STAICATINDKDVVKQVDGKVYQVTVTEENEIAQIIGGLTGIKIDVILDSRYATTKKWEMEDPALSSETSFIWTENNPNSATGISRFGLKWETRNDTVVVFSKDNATKLVRLEKEEWGDKNNQYKRMLRLLIDSKDPIEECAEIVNTGSYNYATYLGVINNGKYYALMITRGELTEDTFIITGQYKD
ncbi:hypothetical protein LJB95_03090, partial [Paludibacteraceae bacterium OttesenSCG-928-F17]|nr:hypothetical protein [Paludibacteraceae bacterium OttesenSCG-928-F17]